MSIKKLRVSLIFLIIINLFLNILYIKNEKKIILIIIFLFNKFLFLIFLFTYIY